MQRHGGTQQPAEFLADRYPPLGVGELLAGLLQGDIGFRPHVIVQQREPEPRRALELVLALNLQRQFSLGEGLVVLVERDRLARRSGKPEGAVEAIDRLLPFLENNAGRCSHRQRGLGDL